MPRITLCFAAADRDVANTIGLRLEKCGFDVLQRSLDASQKTTGTRSRSADCLVVIWSDAAARAPGRTEGVRSAIDAWAANRLVLLARDTTSLPPGLRDLPKVAFTDGSARQIAEALDRVNAVLAVREDAVTTATRPEIDNLRSRAAPAPAPLATDTAEGGGTVKTSRIPVALVVLFLAVALSGGAYFSLRSSDRVPSSRLDENSQPVEARPGASEKALRTPKAFATAKESWSSEDVFVVASLAGLGGIALIVLGYTWHRPRASRVPESRASTPATGVFGLTSPPPTVFVSYSRRDEREVDRLVQQLKEAGVDVWIDRNSAASDRYAGQIVRAIRASHLVALMSSRNALLSDHVIREIYVAGDYSKPFLVFQLDPSNFPDDVSYFITGFPRLRVGAVNRQELLSEIRRLIAAR
jgi:hypothetical protein